MMKPYLALLRGINVGGNNILPMEKLKDIAENLGLQHIQTYLQTGNLFFVCSNQDSKESYAQRIQQGIYQDTGLKITVLVKDFEDMKQVMDMNPKEKINDFNPAQLLVFFLERQPSVKEVQAIQNLATPQEIIFWGKEFLCIYFIQGMGKSKFPLHKIKISHTSRNWNTCNRLCQIMKDTI